jgi:hypothetical protein
MHKWIVNCKQVCSPFSVVSKKIEAETAEQAMQKVNSIDDEYAAVSVRVDFGDHIYDQRTAVL